MLVHNHIFAVSNFRWRWHRSARKSPCSLRPASQRSPQGCSQDSRSVGLTWTTPDLERWNVGRFLFPPLGRLVGLVVKASATRAEDPGFESRFQLDFSGSSHTIDLKIGIPVATLPGAWRYRVSTGTGRPGVSILWLGEVESWICSFWLSVAARKIVWSNPSLRYSSMLLGR